MRRSIAAFFIAGSLLVTMGCAESLHQGQREGVWSSRSSAGYSEGPVYGGAGYWWNPFGYYGSGYGWYGGGDGGTHQPSTPPAPRSTPPDNAPPQFQKKY